MRLAVEGLAWKPSEDCETLARYLTAIATFQKTLHVPRKRGPGYCIKSDDLHKNGFLELRGQKPCNTLPVA
jgi:hypothetical protein